MEVGAPRRNRTFNLLIKSSLRGVGRGGTTGVKRNEHRRFDLYSLESWLSSVAARRDSLGYSWSTAVPPRTNPTAQAPRLTIPPAIVRIERVH